MTTALALEALKVAFRMCENITHGKIFPEEKVSYAMADLIQTLIFTFLMSVSDAVFGTPKIT